MHWGWVLLVLVVWTVLLVGAKTAEVSVVMVVAAVVVARKPAPRVAAAVVAPLAPTHHHQELQESTNEVLAPAAPVEAQEAEVEAKVANTAANVVPVLIRLVARDWR